jgi:hypothetical protein
MLRTSAKTRNTDSLLKATEICERLLLGGLIGDLIDRYWPGAARCKTPAHAKILRTWKTSPLPIRMTSRNCYRLLMRIAVLIEAPRAVLKGHCV